MKDYFFNSMPRSKLNYSKSQTDLINIKRPSLFNLSGSQIINNNNNKKNSIASHLKNNNLLAHKQLDEINNEYHNMKNFLNDKVSKLEEQQQIQFESLRNYLEGSNRLEELKYKERYNNKMLNDLKEEIDYEYNKKKDLEKIRNIDYEEKLGERRDIENKERKKFLEEYDYFKKIQHLNQLERILLQKNRMQKRMYDIYNNRYYPPPSPGYLHMNNISQFMSPLLLELFNRNENKNKQEELVRLILLKELINEDKPKKERPFFGRAPKYFIQKYYPPSAPTKLIPVPQPVFIQPPEQESQAQPYPPQTHVIIQKEPGEIIQPRINIVTRGERRREKTEKSSRSKSPKSHKKKHKHKKKDKKKHKKKHKSPKKTIVSTPTRKTESPPESEPEEDKDEKTEDKEDDDEDKPEDDEENKNEEDKPEQKEDDDESSSQPEVRLKLFDPDNPGDERIVYPVNNQQ